MCMDEGEDWWTPEWKSGNLLRLHHDFKRNATCADRQLPHTVRIVGSADSDPLELQSYGGNAAYRDGDRFRLSRAKARSAYGKPAPWDC